MRGLLTLSFLAIATGPVAAEPNEAEKLFRTLEKKVRDAKSLQVTFELSVNKPLGVKGDEKGDVKGNLILGDGDKYRVEIAGKVFGQAVNGTELSDGVRTSITDPNDRKQDKVENAFKATGAYFRGTLPRWGFFLTSLNMRRSGDLTPDAFELSDFKSGGNEKIGGRLTDVIQYQLKEKKAKDSLSIMMWLDQTTGLPAKLLVSGGTSDWKDITEIYGEWKIDAKVDAKQFELPK